MARQKRVTKQMLDAARMLADGYDPREVAAAANRSVATVYRWMQDDDVMNEYRRCRRRGQVQAVAKAQKVLMKQMESDAGNGFLAQNAASLITNKYADRVMGEDKQEITIHITGGMPEIGVPDQPDSE